MKALKTRLFGLLAILLVCTLGVNAQIYSKSMNRSGNDLVLHVESEGFLEGPQEVVREFDSNFTLELTSGHVGGGSSVDEVEYRTLPSYTASAVALLLLEEMDSDIKVEGWMLEPFEVKGEAKPQEFDDRIQEDDIEIEPWMLNAELW